MAKRNEILKNNLNGLKPKENLVAANAIPNPDTTNLQGYAAYSLDDKLKLLSILNTSKVEEQYYRSAGESLNYLKGLISNIAKEDPYFVAQAIVYSRCKGEGMRTINHVAAVLLAPYIKGLPWAKRFYSLWNKKEQKGGIVFRADDISEILKIFKILNPVLATNPMKKGFASAIENLDSYSLLKYKKDLIDVINIVHPSSQKSKAVVKVGDNQFKTIDAIMQGFSVSADTWEVAQSEAGQIVAQAVKEGKISQEESKQILQEAKADNWQGLLESNKLGILAALRNLRNIITSNVLNNTTTLDILCNLLKDPKKILEGKIMPHQLDLADTILEATFTNPNNAIRRIRMSLNEGYSLAIPNLKDILSGNNLVIIDMSGSMSTVIKGSNDSYNYKSSCLQKASLIGMTIAKATNADVIRFGGHAEYVNYDPNAPIFNLSRSYLKEMGYTNLASAWKLAKESGRKYDRVFILSDHECNIGANSTAYRRYIEDIGNPYVYSIDLAAYGTTSLVGDKVRYYYGYGYSMFDDITKSEFNPNYHIDKVLKITI